MRHENALRLPLSLEVTYNARNQVIFDRKPASAEPDFGRSNGRDLR